MKQCSKCKKEKPFNEFAKDSRRYDKLTTQCKECRNAHSRQYYKDNPDKRISLNKRQTENRKKYYDSPEGVISSRRAHLKRKYNITLEEYNQMSESQDNKCKICGQENMDGRYEVLAVDHCHTTGKIRGLLCGNCNLALGNFKDDIQLLKNAIIYLTKEI